MNGYNQCYGHFFDYGKKQENRHFEDNYYKFYTMITKIKQSYSMYKLLCIYDLLNTLKIKNCD